MKKTTREETLINLQKEIADINKLLSLGALLIVLLFFNSKITLILTVLLTFLQIGILYSKVNTIPNYIKAFHDADFKKFQGTHLFKGMSNQRYHVFLKTQFFKPEDADQIILEYYNTVVKRIYLLTIGTFLLFAFSYVR